VLQNPACPFCSKARGKLLMSQQAAGSRLRERGRDGRKEGRKHSPGWDALCWLHTPTEPRETLGHLLGSTSGSSTSGPGLPQQHHAAQPELGSTCSCAPEGDGTEGTKGVGHITARVARHRSSPPADPPTRVCAFLLPQHFLFSAQTGPQQRCKERSATPRISGNPASKKQPSCSSSRCAHIHRKRSIQHILMELNVSSQSRPEVLPASLSARGREM